MTERDENNSVPQGQDLTLGAGLLARYRAGEDLLAEEYAAISGMLDDSIAVAALGISAHEQTDLRAKASGPAE